MTARSRLGVIAGDIVIAVIVLVLIFVLSQYLEPDYALRLLSAGMGGVTSVQVASGVNAESPAWMSPRAVSGALSSTGYSALASFVTSGLR